MLRRGQGDASAATDGHGRGQRVDSRPAAAVGSTGKDRVLQDTAVQTVLQQAEALSIAWSQ